jgi:beta-lactamase class A
MVGIAPTPSGKGYWLVAADGGVFTFGDAHFYGTASTLHLDAPITAIAPTPDGRGYWLAAAEGGVFTFGDAHFYGAAHDLAAGASIMGMTATPDGRGYWLAASNGNVVAFGDAHSYGSPAQLQTGAPIVGIAATPDGHGYWLAAADGGIFTFGDAHFYGTTSKVHLSAPIVGIAATPDAHGYWLAGADGGIFTFGDAHFYGSAHDISSNAPIAGIAAPPDGRGYWLAEQGALNVFSPTLVNDLGARSGVISASVLDLTNGATYQYRPGETTITASIVKAEILGTLLTQAQGANRTLTSSEDATATQMIEDSDNDSATDLWNEVGGAPAVQAFDNSVGMKSTNANVAWGFTTTTAADQVTLLDHLVHSNAVLSDASRAYELGLMEDVTPDQAWGVSGGTAAGTKVALKNGWLPDDGGWTVNSIGWVSGFGRNYLIAVTTSGDPSMGYGIDSISAVSSAVWNGLAH